MANNSEIGSREPKHEPIVQRVEPLPHPKTEEEIRREAQNAEGGPKIGADRPKH